MAADPDTLIWAFDRLIDCEALPPAALTHTLRPAVEPRGDEALPDTTRARLLLRLLHEDVDVRPPRQPRVGASTLGNLRQLATCEGVALWADAALVLPSPELILMVKTEVVLAQLRAGGQVPPQLRETLFTVFANPTIPEYTRYEEIEAALGNPAATAMLLMAHPYQDTLAELIGFVRTARLALPSVLGTIAKDIASGQYLVGQGMVQQQQPAVPRPMPPPGYCSPQRQAGRQPSPVRPRLAPPAVGLPAPAHVALLEPQAGGLEGGAVAALDEEDVGMMDDGGYDSPLQQRQQEQVPRSTGRERLPVVRELHEELDVLGQLGGQDPLQRMLAAAEGAQVADAAAGAAGAARGRTKTWGEDSPAVQHAAPRMEVPARRQHTPLQRPAGRAAVQAEDERLPEEGAGGGDKPRRRKRKNFSKDEEAALVRLIKEYGRGCWATILKEGQDAGDIEEGRNAVDLKDKWRNLVRKGCIQPHELTEIEAKEEELRRELRDLDARGAKRPPGRPPNFASPAPPKRRRATLAASDGEEEEQEEEQEQDPVEDADVEDEAEEGEEQEGEEEAGEGEDAEREGDDAGEEGGGAGEEGEEQQQEQQEQQGDEDAAGPATAHRIATRSQDVQAGGRGRGRGGRGGRGRGRGGRSSGGRGKAAKKVAVAPGLRASSAPVAAGRAAALISTAFRPLAPLSSRTSSRRRRSTAVTRAAANTREESKGVDASIEGLSSNFCTDFECTSSPSVEASVRTLAKDLQRATGRWTPIYANTVQFSDPFRKFKGPEGYQTLNFVPNNVQGAAVSITGMRMLDNSAAEIRWRLTGKLGVFPVDIAGTTEITMNLLTGRIERQVEKWDLSACSPLAAAAWNVTRALWSAKQASADAGTAANSMLDSLTSMDEDQQVQQQDPNDPTKFFQQNSTFKQDSVLLIGVLLLFYSLVQAWGSLFSPTGGF